MWDASAYMVSRNTHRYWWSWIAAWPFGTNDSWYRILRHVFADHTTNSYNKNSNTWLGAYNEGTEQHQVLGIFHNFSVYPNFAWLEELLKKCGIDYVPPITSASWQYELIGLDLRSDKPRRLHADIAMRIEDSHDTTRGLAVVFEAKRAKGLLKQKDKDDISGYINLDHLRNFDRKYIRFIFDRDDINLSAYRDIAISWQDIYKIQIDQVSQFEISPNAKSYLTEKLNGYLRWYLTTNRVIANERISAVLALPSLDEPLPKDVTNFIAGLDAVCEARLRRPVSNLPEWLASEKSIVEYASEPIMSADAFYEAVW